MKLLKSILVSAVIATTPATADVHPGEWCCNTIEDGDRHVFLCVWRQNDTIWYSGVDEREHWEGTYDEGADTPSIDELCAELRSY